MKLNLQAFEDTVTIARRRLPLNNPAEHAVILAARKALKEEWQPKLRERYRTTAWMLRQVRTALGTRMDG